MPKKLHRALERAARRKGLKPGTPAWDRYVYGGLERAARPRKRKP